MPIFAILYRYTDDSARRDVHRAEHRAFLQGLQDGGMVLARGPWADDAEPGALLLARAESAAQVEQALDGDPFHLEGLIAERTVRHWDVVGDSPFTTG